MNITYIMKDDRLRMEMSGKKGYSAIGLFDPKALEVKILMPQQKMYMSFPLDPAGAAAKAREVDIEETGETREIAGYTCRQFIFKDRKMVHEVWATDELGRFVPMADMQKTRGKAPAWARVLMDRELFPLLMITKDRKGREKTRMEAQKVSPGKVDAAVFEVPEGYQPFSIPGIGNMLKGLGR